MLSRQAEEQLADILVQRIEKANADILGEIGKSLREISTLNISKARQLQMMLKYGGDYNKIARILAKVSGKNVQDIYKIFKQVAINNKEFAKQFYDYRNIAYIPYEQDIALKRQVLAMANITSNIYKNLSRTSQIGLFIDGQYKELEVAYKEIIDKAITTVVQGKEDFHKAMRRTLKEVGGNGLVVYESGKTRRLDSAVRMNMLDGIRMVNNETNRLFGEEYGADGVEITVHENPAPDHEDVQGMQFTNDEYRKLQEEGTALTVEGDTIDISNGKGHRPISELNCYHRPMNIVVGVSKPQYSKKQLQEIKERNEKGFEFEGKHYTMYEGTQLQRQLETATRKNKDTQILARTSGDKQLANESQIKINKLTKKYNDLSKASRLTEKKERMSVSGYRKIKVEMPEEKIDLKEIPLKENEIFISAEEKERVNEFFINQIENDKWKSKRQLEWLETFKEIKAEGYKDEILKLDNVDDCSNLLKRINTEFRGNEIKNTDFNLLREVTLETYKNTIKSKSVMKDLITRKSFIQATPSDTAVAYTQFGGITLNNEYYGSYKKLKDTAIDYTELHEYADKKMHRWWTETAPGRETAQTITHEFGHRLQDTLAFDIQTNTDSDAFEYFFKKYGRVSASGYRSLTVTTKKIKRDLIYEPIRRLQVKTGLTQKEIIEKYVSIYGAYGAEGKVPQYAEMFAEMFANSQLGNANLLGKELDNFLREIGEWDKW